MTLLGDDDQCLSSWNSDNGDVGAGVGLKLEEPRDRWDGRRLPMDP